MHPIFIKALVALLFSSCCGEVFGQELLDQLSDQLKAARSNLRVEPIKCPARMDVLVGAPGGVVVSKLGKPDLSEVGRHSDGEFIVDQYIFANSKATWLGTGVSVGGYSAITPLGDVFTVVQFHYGANHKVVRAFCYER
ncbi:hypothetical protein IB223_16280 [Pseudoxanthomonas sp. PXM03]|jgi:hypothetical protein|uniref:hypothetical protein n=1 Tax=Pseudoxanthomonas sp. PXM03 TaxID=2769284 RepID=UPI00177E08E5|nr:hypothetical protein [Pseudoxanthomonas sp. PXM03]MBD9437655.1 hypothetical protein [Pseudoxanthomonas sp. PXM03]